MCLKYLVCLETLQAFKKESLAAHGGCVNAWTPIFGYWMGESLQTDDHDHYDLQNLSVLELGCGLPFLAAALSGLGAQVCATDHPKVIHRVAETLGAEGLLKLDEKLRQNIRFEPFAWGEELPHCAANVQLVVYDGFPVDALYDSTVQLLQSRNRAVAAVFALQPRKFPMTAALKEPQLIGKFLRRFAQQGWQVSMEPVGQEACDSMKSQVSRGKT
eukprot:s4997_g4.t1